MRAANDARDARWGAGEVPRLQGLAPRLTTMTLGGVVEVLRDRPEWKGVLGLDELARRVVFRAPPPFARPWSLDAAPVGDLDLDRVRLWFEEVLGAGVSRRAVEDAVRIAASGASFHPVRAYLEGLTWDGVPRVDTWLEDLCAVVPASPPHARLVRAVARRWLVSAVARAMTPGCKVDAMLILEGRQGIGKSTALRALAGDAFHCDALLDPRGKEACLTLQGVWIYELPELDAVLRHEHSASKAFLSRSFDRFRAPYARAPESVPRSVVFAGTVNHGGYLRDRTGNRRFWTVRCEGELRVDALRAARDQLWAEARHLFEAGESWHLDRDDEAELREEHATRLEHDPWEELLAAWTARRGDDRFTMNELLESALGLKAQGRNPNVTARVSRLLEGLGFERRRAMMAGRRAYFYARATA